MSLKCDEFGIDQADAFFCKYIFINWLKALGALA
jgi:hypothetical protein